MSNQQPQGPRDQEHHQPTPELIEKFFDLQQKELEVKTQQLQIDAQHEENNKLIAQTSIEAQIKDRDNERGHVERKTKLIFIGSTVIIGLLLFFCGFALYIGKEAVVYKFAEIAGLFAAGFAGGYGTKAAKVARHERQPDKQ